MFLKTFLFSHKMIGGNPAIKKEFVQVLAVESIAEGHFIESIFMLDGRCSCELKKLFVQPLYICAYFDKFRAFADII